MSAHAKIEPGLLSLAGPFTKIARALSNNWRVNIIPSGHACKTDGNTIWIPFNADHLPEEKRQLLHGCLDHEVSHVTEERVHSEAGRATPLWIMKHEPDRFVKWFLNVYEDIRIELKYSQVYPGVAENLHALNLAHYERFKAEPRMAGNLSNAIGVGIIYRARGYGSEFLDEFANGLLDMLASEIERSKRTEWVQDTHLLAKVTVEKIRHILEALEEKLKDSDGDGKGEEGEPEEEDSDGVVVRPEVPELVPPEIVDPMEIVREELARDAKDLGSYVPDPECAKNDRVFKAESVPGFYRRVREEVAGTIGTLRRRQLAYLQSIKRSVIRPGREVGIIDSMAVADAATGSRDVFTDVVKGRTVNTAIECLIDLSGSMGNPNSPTCSAYYAARTAIALAEAWESLRIPYEMIGFRNPEWATPSLDPSLVRRSLFHFPIFKGWDERLLNCQDRFGSITGGGDNVDGEAVLYAASRLALRRERRKILMVISDGEPCASGCHPRVLEAHLVESIKRVSASGIEVFGIGAGTDAPAKFYTRSNGATSLVVKALTDLAPQVFEAMRQRLVRGVAA